VKTKQHTPVWIELIEKPARNEIEELKQEILDIKQMIMSIQIRPMLQKVIEEEWTIKRKTKIPEGITMNYTRGTASDYRKCMEELKTVLDGRELQLAEVG